MPGALEALPIDHTIQIGLLRAVFRRLNLPFDELLRANLSLEALHSIVKAPIAHEFQDEVLDVLVGGLCTFHSTLKFKIMNACNCWP